MYSVYNQQLTGHNMIVIRTNTFITVPLPQPHVCQVLVFSLPFSANHLQGRPAWVQPKEKDIKVTAEIYCSDREDAVFPPKFEWEKSIM